MKHVLLIGLRDRVEQAKHAAVSAQRRSKGQAYHHSQGQAYAFDQVLKWIKELAKEND
jgi:hypothetical protein